MPENGATHSGQVATHQPNQDNPPTGMDKG